MPTATAPTSICNPTIIRTLPPATALRTVRVATVNDSVAMRQSTSPARSIPPVIRAPMISETPMTPATSPVMAMGFSCCPISNQPKKATINGMVEAMIDTTEASIHCMATKIRPRYSAFWHRPKMTVDCHCSRERRQLCPIMRAMITPSIPEIRKRIASAVNGGAYCTMIRPDVKAEDHISAKPSPIRIARKSICQSSNNKGRPLATLCDCFQGGTALSRSRCLSAPWPP